MGQRTAEMGGAAHMSGALGPVGWHEPCRRGATLFNRRHWNATSRGTVTHGAADGESTEDRTQSADGASATGGRVRRGPAVITIDRVRCKGCSICVEFCPRGVLEMAGAYPRVIALDRCTLCQMCDALCPDFAIIVREAE